MCGIAGVYHYASSGVVDESSLIAMRDTMAHRGPDDAGVWVAPHRRAGLAHRRLSIIDLQHNAAQPICNEDGTVWITFNGEIYNHGELRKQLLRGGHRFVTHHSDTEVLVHGFEEWGIDGLIRRLKGMFAFAVFDVRGSILYLVRDRVGIKPLYFSLRQGILLFASEIKALFQYPCLDPEMSSRAMYHYLSFLTAPAPMTLFKDVYKLPAGHLLRIEDHGRLKARRYWDALPGAGIAPGALNSLSAGAREDFYIEGIRTKLEQAVQRRMMADVPYGAFLSGGIDSSTNVAMMKRFTDRPIRTFTVGFSDHGYLNELEYARKVAEHFKTDHHQVLIGEKEMTGYLDNMVYHQDEPIADWVCIPLYFVARLARENGVKVIQVGEGADEQFAGYQGYLDFLRLAQTYWRPFTEYLPAGLQQTAASAARRLARRFPSLASRADIVHRAAHGREPFWTGATLFWETQKEALINKDAFPNETVDEELLASGLLSPAYATTDSFEIIRSFRDRIDACCPQADALTRMIYNEFKLRLPELLLMRVDKITMSTSLEARVPFLDHELVEFTMDIGMQSKIGSETPKRLFKSAVKGLIPDEIIDRPKMGFGAPMKDWLRGPFGTAVQGRLSSSPVMTSGMFNPRFIDWLFAAHQSNRDMSSYIWALYNLSAWHDRWIAGK